jgi:hypothetical protein
MSYEESGRIELNESLSLFIFGGRIVILITESSVCVHAAVRGSSLDYLLNPGI